MLLFTYHKKLIAKAKIFLTQTQILMSLVQWCRNRRALAPQYLADQLTLFQLGMDRLCPPITTGIPNFFFTFRHHCGLLTWFTSGISKCNDYQLTSFLTYSTVDGMVMTLEENIKKSKFGPTESSRDMLWCRALNSGTMGAKFFWTQFQI